MVTAKRLVGAAKLPKRRAAKAGPIRQPHDAQRLGDGAFARCQDRTGHQHKDVVPDRCREARPEHGQPGNEYLRCMGDGGGGFGAIGLHRSLGIAMAPSRKSPRVVSGDAVQSPATGPVASLIVSSDGRCDYPENRAIPMPRGRIVRGTSEPRLHPLRCGIRRTRARLRPAGHEGRFEVLYWSLWKERWASAGPFGRTILSAGDALQFIAHEDIFWAMT